MTSAHILYIPTIFMLGFLAGTLLRSKEISHADNLTKSKSAISGWMVLSSFLVFLFVFVGTHFLPIPRSTHAIHHALNGAEIFDKAPAFSSEEVHHRISSLPSAGIFLYKQFTYTTDLLFPLAFFSFLFLVNLYVSERALIPKRVRRILLAIPVIWFLSDLVENAIIFHLLDIFPIQNIFLSGALGYLTVTKFILLLMAIATPVVVKLLEKTFVRKFSL